MQCNGGLERTVGVKTGTHRSPSPQFEGAELPEVTVKEIDLLMEEQDRFCEGEKVGNVTLTAEDWRGNG